MEHFVNMPSLPPGIKFPPQLADRLRYDGERQRLVWSGFMSKSDFDRISRLSEDWAYRRQVEELFRRCGPENARPGVASRIRAALTMFGL